jgi:hypothetical protein
MNDIRRRLERLEGVGCPTPEDAGEREEKRQNLREEAEHANYCGWGREFGRWPLFEIDEDGDVFCAHDGRPVTDSRQIPAELFYWMEVEWGGLDLVHDEEAEAFYTPDGELAVSRDRFDLRYLLSH